MSEHIYKWPTTGLWGEAKQATHAFNRATEHTVARAQAVAEQRGGEYEDSWALDNMLTPFVDLVLRMIGDAELGTGEVTPQLRRLLVVASLIDAKLSRLGGPWKEDHGLDLINYIGAFTTWAAEL